MSSIDTREQKQGQPIMWFLDTLERPSMKPILSTRYKFDALR